MSRSTSKEKNSLYRNYDQARVNGGLNYEDTLGKWAKLGSQVSLIKISQLCLGRDHEFEDYPNRGPNIQGCPQQEIRRFRTIS